MKGFLDILKRNSGKIQTSASTIVKILIVISMFYATYFHLWQILFADIFLLILMFMPLILKKSYEVHMPRGFELIIILFVIVSFFLGTFRGLVIQIFFGIAAGFVGFAIMLILFSNSTLKKNYFLIILFSLSFSVAFGLGAELAKYYLKLILDFGFVDNDYAYTMRSLTFVSIGSLISATIGFLYMKGYKLKIMRYMVKEFKNKNPNLFIEKTDSPEGVLKLIKKGENEKLEFKSTLRANLHTGEHDKKIENSALKTIVAFLNSDGGSLLIGISDTGEICGIEKDGFENNDKFNRHFTNLIKERVGNEFLPFMNFELILIEGRTILKVDCMKSDKPVFLKCDSNEEFYIRVGASTLLIIGSKILDYIENRFRRI
jgi:hypothetical protein